MIKKEYTPYTMWEVDNWKCMKKPGPSEPYIITVYDGHQHHYTGSFFLEPGTPELAVLAILQRLSGQKLVTNVDSIIEPYKLKKWPGTP